MHAHGEVPPPEPASRDVRRIGIAFDYDLDSAKESLAEWGDWTYMSIAEMVRWRVAEGAIYPLIPASGSVLRAMFVTESLWTALNASYEDEELEERMGRLQADLEFFASSPSIDPKYLFHLYPARDSVWEIRSVRDAPSIRVLGLFAQKNAFIATTFAIRADLGGWQSREWKQVKRTARQRWATLFYPYAPCATTNVHDVVKGAVNGKYFKARS